MLSGKISCLEPERGFLSGVIVFNQNKDWGTLTDSDGTFHIQMDKNDTIVFTTPQHEDYVYFIKGGVKFEDHSIEIIMEPDAIWLETVTIIGNRSLEEFKKEILQLDTTPDNEVNITLPVVNKYTKQLATGDGELVLAGPLTYLVSKFSHYNRMVKKIKVKE